MGAYAYVVIFLRRSCHDTLVDSRPKALMMISHVDVLFMTYVCFRASSHVALDIEPLEVHPSSKLRYRIACFAS